MHAFFERWWYKTPDALSCSGRVTYLTQEGDTEAQLRSTRATTVRDKCRATTSSYLKRICARSKEQGSRASTPVAPHSKTVGLTSVTHRRLGVPSAVDSRGDTHLRLASLLTGKRDGRDRFTFKNGFPCGCASLASVCRSDAVTRHRRCCNLAYHASVIFVHARWRVAGGHQRDSSTHRITRSRPCRRGTTIA